MTGDRARLDSTPTIGDSRPTNHDPRGIRHWPAALRGALWMGGAVASFSVMAVAARELLRTMGTFEILFLRSVVSLAIVLALLPGFGLAALRTRRPGLHVARNVMHYAGQCCWVYAISVLPLATVFAIEFTMPVWAAVLAMLILGERMNRGRAVMLALGLAGILVILRPGVAPVSPAALVMLAGAFAYASIVIATKSLSKSDPPYAILFYMAAVQVPISLLPALPGWVAPGWADLPWIVAVGASGLVAHFCMVRAFRVADAMVVVPVDFLRLPLIAVVGALLYDEPLDPLVFLGAAVIFAGTYYSIRRESR